MGNQQAPQNPPKKIQRPPQIINGYSIGKKLGSGGFGDVFEAYKNNNVYAIKTPKQSFQDYQQNMQEALMMTSIESEHFVKVYEYFVFKNRFFIVMEKCDMDLETKLKNSNLTLQQRINYCTQIIEGVNYLHCNKIAHRDLKPKNILIKNGAIKISDLGLAMFISRLRCQTICGTYDYMAPQRFKGQAFNQAIDTYALGLILLIILSGKTIQYFQGYGFVGCLEQFPKEIVRGCLKRNPCERKSVPNIASQLLIRKMQINNSQKTNLSQISQSKIISEITAENNPYQNSQQVQNYEIYINQQIRAYIDLCSQI